MDPDHCDGLSNILWRSEEFSCIDDVIFGLDVDKLLCEFSGHLVVACAARLLSIARAALIRAKTAAAAAAS